MVHIDARKIKIPFLKEIPTIVVDDELRTVIESIHMLCDAIDEQITPNNNKIAIFSFGEFKNFGGVKIISKAFDEFVKETSVLPFVALRKYFLSSRNNGDPDCGIYRTSISWISRDASGSKQISNLTPYVAINATEINKYMEELFEFVDSSQQDACIKIALMHYQFFAIHPFIDGNGRVNRALIFFLLNKYGIINTKIYLETTLFEKDRIRYAEEIQLLHETGDHKKWVTYFLTTMTRTLIEINQSIERK